jgi:hypothetical protein
LLTYKVSYDCTKSFKAFTGLILTCLLAGLALRMVGSFVNGLIPSRSSVAGLRTTCNFINPGIVNTPRPLSPRFFAIKPES